MRNSSNVSNNGPMKCCTVCGGKFGLIRHYHWRRALCSRKCVGRFKARCEADHKWLRLVAGGLVNARDYEADLEGKYI
ncbi:hypothetical protein ACVWXM_009660 [Bradyrhizobium sp. GM7.3]